MATRCVRFGASGRPIERNTWHVTRGVEFKTQRSPCVTFSDILHNASGLGLRLQSNREANAKILHPSTLENVYKSLCRQSFQMIHRFRVNGRQKLRF